MNQTPGQELSTVVGPEPVLKPTPAEESEVPNRIYEQLRQAIHRGCRRHAWHNMYCFECIAEYQAGLFRAIVDLNQRLGDNGMKFEMKEDGFFVDGKQVTRGEYFRLRESGVTGVDIQQHDCIQPIAYKVRRKNDGVEYGPFETLSEANVWIGTHGHNELICIYPGQEI